MLKLQPINALVSLFITFRNNSVVDLIINVLIFLFLPRNSSPINSILPYRMDCNQ